MKKTTRRLCLLLSIGSLLALAAYVICIFTRGPSVMAYYNRHDLLCAALTAISFMELSVFILLEPTLRYINKRWLVFGIFFTYVVQMAVFIFTGHGTEEHLVFLNNAMNGAEFLMEIIAIFRLILLFAVLFLNRWTVKVYALFMIGASVFSAVSLIDLATYIDTYLYGYAVAIAGDILFHAALFFFADVMTEDNDLFMTSDFLWRWLGPKDELLDDFEDSAPAERPLAVDYKLISLYAAAHEKPEFVQTALFFGQLAQEKFWDADNRYYTIDDCLHHLGQLQALAEEINQQWDGYISDDFVYIIVRLLTTPQEYTWKADVMAAAMLFTDQSAASWFQAISQHEDYHDAHPTESVPSEEPTEEPLTDEQPTEQPQE